ncbi:hypothetical protein RJ640_019153 [Escallonia rubra]|uniref:Branchless trichome n=1 Tax=Escallonia rubra TaxID=112253 RepID=A0AA88R3V1_9ASTE|nr:hypothetical protein RJ640_019153 [Escallonia rubra]
MEEMMMVMMVIRSTENLRNESIFDPPISTSTCPTWKLYENPFYYPPQQPPPHIAEAEAEANQDCKDSITAQKQIHRLHLPASARKIAASFWDLTFIKPFMESELDIARAKIVELKAELEQERSARKKIESRNKRLAKEISEEKKGREALERVCEELAKEISSDKTELNRMKKEMEEERKMLRVAEVIREERVQMKLNEAKLVLEEKLLELEDTKQVRQSESTESAMCRTESKKQHDLTTRKWVIGEKSAESNGTVHSVSIQRRASPPEAENPHIKRGIKGFVEFPKVVRAIGSKSRHLGTKLECQKAQLMILLKHRSPIRSNNLIMS